MKIASATLLASVLLLNVMGGSLRAQPPAPEAEPDKATAALPKEPATRNRDDGVRIDGTGIHVGGEEPVDINMPDWGRGIGPTLPIISVVAFFGSPVAIIGFIFYFRHRRNRLLHETLRAMIEKGVPIPPELFSGGGAAMANASNGATARNNDLRYGLVFIGLGIALFALVGKFGLIPLLIGVAMIVAWLIGQRTRKNVANP